MSENKEGKKGFWSTLFAPKKKSSCCCGSQIEIVPDNTDKQETPACSCATDNSGRKVIKVLGTGCSSCKALYSIVQDAVTQFGIDATVEKEKNLEKIIAYNVMSLPALVIDCKVVAKGQKLSLEQVKDLIK